VGSYTEKVEYNNSYIQCTFEKKEVVKSIGRDRYMSFPESRDLR